MSFKKIALYSLVISSLAFNHNITAMDIVEESIKKELFTLDASIISIAKDLKQAKEQKEKDEKIFNECMRQREFERNNSWGDQATTDYSKAVKAYKGEIIASSPFTPDHFTYSNTGSEAKYNDIKNLLFNKKITYLLSKQDFKRGKRHNNQEFLKDVELDLQKINSENK